MRTMYHPKKLPEARLKKRIAVAAVALFTLLAPSTFAGPKGAHRSHAPQGVRVVSMSQTGGNVTLRLEDGRSIEAPENRVRLMSDDFEKSTGASAKAAKANKQTIGSLSAMSSPLPAIATVIYGKDGSIRRVRVRVFESNDAANAFSKSKAGSK